VDDSSCIWSHLTEGMYMSHDIVTSLFLFCSCRLEVLVCHGNMILELLECLIADFEAKLFLTLGEPDPELTPCRGTSTRREELKHLLTYTITWSNFRPISKQGNTHWHNAH